MVAATNFATDNDNADQKARILEGKLLETAETIEQLRQERSLLAADHKQLQRKYTEISEVPSQNFSCYSVLMLGISKQAICAGSILPSRLRTISVVNNSIFVKQS